ncbi:hypothetical protein [Brachybacterium sp. YJGR34]|uniref:hypothetical protein n=1 Tax=Brachybacterium sp. YJGR34 TaxID=2059911 RepID=UPI0013009162|nr:hypothetical protein [Brachybacterium sp. YJGR34]
MPPTLEKVTIATPDSRRSEQPPPPPLRRRAVMKGVVWTAPAAAFSVAAPALAASGATPTLEFEVPSFEMASCGTLEEVVIHATTDGSQHVPPGTVITITLPEGFEFVDGSTSPLELTVEAEGMVVLPAVRAPLSSDGAVVEARSGSLLATAEIALGPPVGTRLYAGNVSFVPHFLALPETGLPSGYRFESIHATDGAVFVTLGDGTLWVARENPTTGTATGPVTWYSTGLVADAAETLISSSPNVYDSLLLVDGALHTVTVSGTWTTTPTTSPLANPPGGAPVQIGVSNGVGTFYAETADGRLWSTPRSGGSRGTWSQITGFPTPLTDWFIQRGNGSEVVWVIGADGALYSNNATTGARPSVLTNRRHASAAWVAPLSHFAKNHADSAMGGSGAAFVDAGGNMFHSSGAQNRDFSGVLAGQLGDLELLRTVDSLGATTNTIIHVVDGGRLYAADLTNSVPFADITPPQSLLQGATIVDAHSTGSGLSGRTFAIDSNSVVWVSNRYVSGTPRWSRADGLPARLDADGIVQDGKFTYVLGGPDSCPS